MFQRQRKWNPSERKWIGWERKRGKLVEFVELLKGKKDTSFINIEGDRSTLADIRYILTLDSDTQLPLESAHRMIGTLHFPYNQPRLNQSGTRVVEGYGVLQPRVAISHEATTRSNLANLWSSDTGIDPYAFAVSDASQRGRAAPTCKRSVRSPQWLQGRGPRSSYGVSCGLAAGSPRPSTARAGIYRRSPLAETGVPR